MHRLFTLIRRQSHIHGQVQGYDGLVMYGFSHERINHSKRFTNEKVYINGIKGFWSYAKGRLLKYHGLSAQLFPLHLKEPEFRYNMRDRDLYEELLNILKVD